MFGNHSTLCHVLHCLIYERLNDLNVFNASKLLNPEYYPSDEVVHVNKSKQRLERLIVKFGLMGD